MNKASLRVFFAIMLLMVFGGVKVHAQEHVIDDSQAQNYLFVMSGKEGKLEGEKLVIKNINRVVYFSDRPQRKAGHISLQQFVDNWDKGEMSFASVSPNAALSYVKDDRHVNKIIELSSPVIDGDNITFTAKYSGRPKENVSFGHVSLFIDNVIFSRDKK